MKLRLTIFTPTYNREKELTKVYNSLLQQTDKNFEWLIIDDGSIDNTFNVVKKWIKEKKINISFFSKKNGGKHTAYNYALDKCNTEYIFIALDSDDTMPQNAVKEINELLESNKDCKGIVGLTFCDNGNNYNDIEKYNGKSLSDVLCNNIFCTETSLIIKVDYLRQFKYPVIKNEKFFTEAYTYYQMEEPFIWVNKVFRNSSYMEDGLTKNIYKLYMNNPKSFYLFQKLKFYKVKKLKKKIKSLISKNAFYILSGEKEKLDFISKLTMPLGFLYSRYINNKYKKYYK